ncbi:MAG: TIR domain-containing protein [Armatimonadetes bacterium]|nr:TIR domain-containing protein [Armatimonadota bacterium]NOG93346.1 TIR domain-containing protein [Armatimonadota bacterium]
MGGGGGGGRGLTPDELRDLEQKAKKAMKDPVSTGKCNVFISFAAEDLNDVNMLRGQARNENSDIEFNDWSLKEPFDSEKAEYIKRRIRERIRQCSVTVVYISDETADSKWVDWEVRESIAMGKGVVAMHKGDTPPTRLPKAITDNKVPVVPWNQKELAKAIKKQSENR